MDRCPLCRATLVGGDICRRCRADLGAVKALVRMSQALAAAATHRLAEGDLAAAHGLAQRAVVLHATPENRNLAAMVQNLGDRPIEDPASPARVRCLATLPDDGGDDGGDDRPERHGEQQAES